MNLDPIDYVVFLSILFVLVGLFLFQLIQKQHYLWPLFISMIFALLASTFDTISEFVPDPLFQSISNALRLTFYGFMILFWYIHLEFIQNVRVISSRFGILLFLLVLDISSAWFIVLFRDQSNVLILFWFFNDLGLNSMGILVFLVFSTWINYRTYRYSKDKKAILLIVVYFIVGLGFTLIELSTIFSTFWENNTIINIVGDVGYGLTILGLLGIIFLYDINVDFVFRLPFDVFTIILSYLNSGNQITSIFFKTKSSNKINTSMVSSLLVAMNGLFGEIFNSPRAMNHVTGTNAHLLLESGKHVIGIVISETVSNYLASSLKQFIKTFERHFAAEIERREPNNRAFKNVVKLIRPIFPYFEIDYSI